MFSSLEPPLKGYHFLPLTWKIVFDDYERMTQKHKYFTELTEEIYPLDSNIIDIEQMTTTSLGWRSVTLMLLTSLSSLVSFTLF